MLQIFWVLQVATVGFELLVLTEIVDGTPGARLIKRFRNAIFGLTTSCFAFKVGPNAEREVMARIKTGDRSGAARGFARFLRYVQ